MSAPDQPPSEPKLLNAAAVSTGGGAHVEGSVNTGGGTFIGRDQINYVHPPQKATLSAAQIAAYEDAYLAQVRRACRYIHTEGIGEPTTELTGVFVLFEAMAKPESSKAVPQYEAIDIAPLSERFAQMGQSEPARSTPQEPLQPPLPPVPLSQALHDHAHLVVLGEPGTGKSTTVQYVALCLATPGWAAEKLKLPEGCIPVQLNLRSCDGVRMLPDFLADEIARLGMFDAADSVAARRIAVTLLGTWLQEKRLVLLLDALDETAEAQRAAVLEQIARFAASREGRDCRIVVTSRIAGYNAARRPGADFAEYIIHPFASPADALPYIRGWLQALASGTTPDQVELQAKTIIDHMAQQQGLKRILGTPLLLRLAVAVYVETGRLFANRAEVYRRYVDEVLWQRTQAHRGTQFAHEDVQQAIAYVAWMLHRDAKTSSAQLASGIERVTGGQISGEQMLAFLQHNLGLLAAYAYDRGPRLAFRHLTFQEFLVGRHLAERWLRHKDETWRLLRPRLHHPAWREPLLLMAGMLPLGAANDLIRRIVRAKSRYERELHRDLLLAMSVAGDCGCTNLETIHQLTSHALTITRNSLDYFRSRMTRFGPTRRRLLFVLRWPSGIAADTQIRGQILRQLGVSAVPALIQALADSDSDMRRAAAEALGKIGDAAAVPALLKALADSDLSLTATSALFEIRDTAAVPVLLGALLNSDSGTRIKAALALGEIGDAAALPALLEALSDSDSDMRMIAAKALGDIGRVAAEVHGKLGGATAVPALVKTLSDTNSNVRQYAALALGEIGDEAAVPALLKTLSDTNHGVRWKAAEALGKIDDAAAMTVLLRTLSDPDSYSDVRRVAAEALGKIGDAVAVPALLQALSDINDYVRRAAAEALGKIGDAAAVPALVKTVSDFCDSYSEVGTVAAEALGKIGDAAAVPTLIKALSGVAIATRGAAAVALGDIGDAAAVSALLKAMSDSAYHVRMAAAVALSKIDDAAAMSGLLTALSDSDFDVRRAAAAALGDIEGDAAAVPALVNALSDINDYVRRAAAEALGKIGDAAAVHALVTALSDSDSDVRLAAAFAVGKIGDAAALPALVTALSDASSYVRRAAAKALGDQKTKYNELDSANIDRIAKKLAICVYDRDGDVVTAAIVALEQAATALAIRETANLGRARQFEW